MSLSEAVIAHYADSALGRVFSEVREAINGAWLRRGRAMQVRKRENPRGDWASYRPVADPMARDGAKQMEILQKACGIPPRNVQAPRNHDSWLFLSQLLVR